MAALLGIKLSSKSINEMVNDALNAIEIKSNSIMFACANVHSLVVAQTNMEFQKALLNVDHLVADGVGVSIAARIAKIEIGQRITGMDYFLCVMKTLNEKKKGKIFFLGSSSETIHKIEENVKKEFQNISVSGVYSPPIYPWSIIENDEIIKTINSCTPDVLWVGMTAPKQEIWVSQNRTKLNVPLIGCIGAVFDFYAGNKLRAPKVMRKFGFEWFHRLATEPRRMWRRDLSIPKFIYLIIRKHIFMK